MSLLRLREAGVDGPMWVFVERGVSKADRQPVAMGGRVGRSGVFVGGSSLKTLEGIRGTGRRTSRALSGKGPSTRHYFPSHFHVPRAVQPRHAGFASTCKALYWLGLCLLVVEGFLWCAPQAAWAWF